MSHEQQTHLKSAGSKFWDNNPCGGEWDTYQTYLDWLRTTEHEGYDFIDTHEWHGLLVADIGCGQGPLSNYLCQVHGADVVGVDISANSLRSARRGASELGTSAVFALGDAEQIPLPDNTFDTVVSIGVLHHTPDTQGAIHELHRIARPGGKVIVMLYRSGTPKWWATSFLRHFFYNSRRASRIRQEQDSNNSKGTALRELFGVPVMKAYSNRQARQMFARYEDVTITNRSPGFARLPEYLPLLNPLRPLLRFIDSHTQKLFGFYQFIEGRKKPNGD